MPYDSLIPKTIRMLLEPAVRSRADRLYVLAGGRAGSEKHKPRISTYYETGIVVALYEFLLMSPDLAHLEIRHENPYRATTRPEQVDLWIRPPKGGKAHLIECGDFSPGKVKSDASKMRKHNRKGFNWFLAFFRGDDDEGIKAAKEPWKKLMTSRKRQGSLKGCHIELDEKFTGSFVIKLPKSETFFGYSLIRVK